MDLRYEFGDPERISARLAFHERVIAEEAVAAEICDRVLTGPSRWWKNALDQVEGCRTAGMVAVLIERGGDLVFRSAINALALAEIAVDVADQIDTAAYPYHHVYKIRGQALLQHAFVLSFVGRSPEAAKVAERSEHYLKQIPVPPPQLARLDLVRSNIARTMEQYDQAIAFARRAGENFLRFGDREGWVKSLSYQAAAHFGATDHRKALEVWSAMGAYAAELGPEFAAARLHNMGLCASELGNFDEAARAFALACEAWERLGLTVHRVKCGYTLGLALHNAGRYEEAIAQLEKAWRELEEIGMQGDAALAALLLAEGLLIVGRRDEVPAISRMLIDRCTRAGMPSSAMTAFAFLRETVARDEVTPLLVRHVREFMLDTHLGRERPFLPPPRQLFAEPPLPRGET